jgi:hypothetical protein
LSATVQLDNYGSPNLLEKSLITADVAKSASPVAVSLQNTQGISANDFIVLGRLGNEGTEKVTVNSVDSATQITVAALTLNHKAYESAMTIVGDQLKVYRASNVDGSQPADTSFVALTPTKAIDFDQLTTYFTDSAGGSDYWYKYVYYNSATTLETALANSSAVRGGGYGHYVSIDQIKREAGFQNNDNITGSMVDERRIQAEGVINDSLSGMYGLPFSDPVPATIVRVAMLLAAGYLLKSQYDSFTVGSGDSEGDKKIKEGMELLAQVKSGQITLQDVSGSILKSSYSVVGWPDATTATADVDQGGSERAFRSGMDW